MGDTLVGVVPDSEVVPFLALIIPEEELKKVVEQEIEGETKPLTEEDREKMEAFVLRWNGGVTKILLKFGLKNERLDDMKSLIFLEYLEGGYCNIFDPTKGSEQTFVYNFVKRRVLREYTKGQRNPLRLSINNKIVDHDTGELIDVLDTMSDPSAEGIPETLEKEYLLDKILERVRKFGLRNPHKVGARDRSLAEVFACIKKDMSRKEIAKELGYSEATICLMMKQLVVIARQVRREIYTDYFQPSI